MYNPLSTYRLQFHRDFAFRHLQQIIPYLQELGIKTIYASPVLEATPGSTHGYDGINPHRINPEIGTEEELKAIKKTLDEYNIGWIQDIAPNHMAYRKENTWLMDVLLNGRSSVYAGYFDIIWDSPLYEGRIMVPFQGSELESFLKEKDPAETHYKICHWQDTDKQINYRRFFTVNDLICLNIHDKNVFDGYHQYISYLLTEGIFQGLRIDHIDGLYDPLAYLENIRTLAGSECFIIVEKILEQGERIPDKWPMEGNTGYDFLSLVNNLFTRAESEKDFLNFYETLVEDKRTADDQAKEKKAHILHHYMQGELENLYRLLLASLPDNTIPASEEDGTLMKEAIGELLINCPVYRFYGNKLPLDKEETEALKNIFSHIKQHKLHLASPTLLLENFLLTDPLKGNPEQDKKTLHFYQRCMQFSGPLMAKGVEDTLMYTYNKFIGHNEVGDSPTAFGVSTDDFHTAMQERLQSSPLSLNATATHDTKRGEDVRARLNVLTDLKEEWFQAVESWYRLNTGLQAQAVPDINDEYLIYQSLLGSYPMPGQDDSDFRERFEQYITKSLREAKRKSSWAQPDEAYEEAARSFAARLLVKGTPFWKSFTAFHTNVADMGITNSLAQLILKFTCPGTPDIYQGCELWDLSFVDPDNRRPVDYVKRSEWLKHLDTTDKNRSHLINDLWETRFDGRIKLWMIHLLLKERRQYGKLFSEGNYIKLETKGEYQERVIAFARHLAGKWMMVVVPLHVASLCKSQDTGVRNIDWKNTRINLPAEAPVKWKNIFTGLETEASGSMDAHAVFTSLPMAILKG